MKIQIKTALILVVTLLIGMMLGALIHGTVMRNRIKKTALGLRTPHSFTRRMEAMLDLDESQREAVEDILMRHHQRMTKYRLEVRVLMDSLQKELEPILTDEQKARLNRPPFFRGEPGRKPPPFGRRPEWRRKPGVKPDSLKNRP